MNTLPPSLKSRARSFFSKNKCKFPRVDTFCCSFVSAVHVALKTQGEERAKSEISRKFNLAACMQRCIIKNAPKKQKTQRAVSLRIEFISSSKVECKSIAVFINNKRKEFKTNKEYFTFIAYESRKTKKRAGAKPERKRKFKSHLSRSVKFQAKARRY
jgi:hypothetical protein